MRSVRLAAITLAAAGLVVGGGATAAFASHASSHPASHAASANPHVARPNVAAATAEKAGTTYFVNGYLGTTVSSGFAAVDGLTSIKCAKTCTIEVDQNVQVISSDSSNRWAICTEIDGTYIGNCPYLGYAPTAFYGTGTWLQSATLAKGTHKVQDFVYSDDGLDVDTYSFAYRVFTP